jgi:EF hand/EF-hand domain pair
MPSVHKLWNCHAPTWCVVTLLSACAAGDSVMSGASAVDQAFVSAAPTWDLDRDGTVTCEEWQLYASRLFAKFDLVGKGYLSPEEFRNLAFQDRLFETADFVYFDADRDGRVSRAEFVEKPNPAFRLLDKDHDCRLSNSELIATYAPPANSKTKDPADTPPTKGRR